MKAIVCEMCNSNDLVKQDGLFICQNCGTKYSVEEARKLLVEGIVIIDNSEELDNLYQLARRAKDADNDENAAKYYDLILIKNPSCWEANFYSVYYKSRMCKIAEISTAATNVSNCINDTFKLIDKNVTDPKKRKGAIIEVRDKSKSISDMLFNAAISHMSKIDPMVKSQFKGQYLSNVISAGEIPKYVCDSLCEIFIEDKDVMSDVGIQILKERINEGIAVDDEHIYVKTIQKYEPTYQAPRNQTTEDIANSIDSLNRATNNGCYIATAIYGSYDCEEVWTLRRFRDDTLASTWYGRAFIKTYYAISPTLVKWFGETQWFKNMWKPTLDKMVRNLNNKGVENTPYSDKQW